MKKIGKGERISHFYRQETWTHDKYGLAKGWVVVATLLAAFVVLISGVVVFGVKIDRHFAGKRCDGLERVLGQDTFMADYSFFSYSCLTDVDGQLVSAEDYVEMTQIRVMDK